MASLTPTHVSAVKLRLAVVSFALISVLLAATASAPARAYEGWNDPATVSGSPSAGYSPRVEFVADGSAVAVWQSTARKQVWGARSTDSGETWSTPVLIASTGSRTVASLDLGVDEGGKAVVIWTTSSTLQLSSAVSADGGLTWSAPTVVSGSDKANEPHIVSPQSGVFAIVWTTPSPSYLVRASWSNNSGTSWGAPQQIAANAGGLTYSDADANAGIVVVAWQQTNAGTSSVATSTSRDLGATWAATEVVGPGWNPYLAPAVEVAADGSSFLASSVLISADVYAIESVRRSGSDAWSTPVRVSAEGEVGMAAIAAGTDGATVASWYRADESGTVWVDSASSSDSGTTWSESQQLFTAAYGIYDPPRLIVGPQNIFVAATSETATADRHALVRRSLDGGATWEDAVDLSVTSSWWPAIAVDSAGSLLSMWALTGSQTVQASGTVIPTVTSSAPTKATVGAEYSYTLTASGTAPVSWTISNGSLPDGLSLDSHGGISGTPTSEGTSTFSARASNFAGWEDVELSITVGAPPVITSGSPQSATVGEAYSFGFTATGVAPMSWAVTSGTLPPGLEFSAAGALTGTPAEVGSTTFAVTVTDDNGTAAQDVTLVVTPAPLPPVITSGEPDVATVGDSYSFTFTATGTAPVTWAMTVGTLPQGLSLSNSGVLSGTPTVAGTYTFTLAASDENGRTTKDITLSVTAANTVPPVITSSATIVDVVEGKPFNFQFTATGTGPFTWLVAAGAGALSLDGPRSMGMSVGAALPTPGLPPGLTVSASGLLSGVPTAEGTYGFTIRATGPGGTQTQSVEVTVIPVSADGDLATTGSSNDMLAIATLIALLALALGIVLAMRRGRA